MSSSGLFPIDLMHSKLSMCKLQRLNIPIKYIFFSDINQIKMCAYSKAAIIQSDKF